MAQVELVERRTYRASLDEVWVLLSNSDAFNRTAGFGMEFERGAGGTRGRMLAAGIPVEWDQEPYDYCEESWFRIVRDFEGGLIARAEAMAQFFERGDEVEIDYRIRLRPRHWLLWPLIWLVSRTVVRSQARKGLAGVERAIRGGPEALDPPPPLESAAKRALAEGLEQVDQRLRRSLENRILNAPLVVQDRLRPKLIARQDGHDPVDTAVAMLQAVRAGVLELRWLLLCPRCRGDEEDRAILDVALRGLHCDSCGIRYDAALVDNVEAVFRPAPRLGRERSPVDCIVSPSRTPHVLLQCPLPAADELTFNVRLAEGTYLLEAPQASCSIQIVAGGATPEELRLDLVEQAVYPEVLDLGPGKYRLIVKNHRTTPARVMLSRRWRPSYGLTASELLSETRLQELLPDGALAGDHATRTMRGGVLVLETQDADAYDSALAALRQLADGVFELGLTLIAATFESVPAVLSAAEVLAGLRLPVRVAVSSGVTVVLEVGGREELAGRPVQAAVEAVRQLQVPQIGLASDAPELLEAIEANRSTVRLVDLAGRPAVLVFSATIDGISLYFQSGSAPVEKPGIPDEIAGYRVLSEIGEGANGRVLEVEDPMEGRFAMKVPHWGHVGEAQRMAFLQEGLSAKRIDHPNVVGFRDWGVDGDVPYLVMEYLEGRTLASELEQKGAYTPEQARAVLLAVLGGLEAVHAQGLVHRDVKPMNLLLLDDPAGVPAGIKLVDFGLAIKVGRRSIERVAGTPDYMAPEQLLLTGVDPRTDLFSVGVLAYWLLSLSLPFDGATSGQRALHRLDGPSRDRVLGVPELGDLRPIIDRALRLDPAERYTSAREMAADLGGALTQATVSVLSTSDRPRAPSE